MTSLDIAFNGITMQTQKDKKNKKSKKDKKENDFIPEQKIKTNQSLKKEESLTGNDPLFDNNDYIPFSFINNKKFPNDIQQNINYNTLFR